MPSISTALSFGNESISWFGVITGIPTAFFGYQQLLGMTDSSSADLAFLYAHLRKEQSHIIKDIRMISRARKITRQINAKEAECATKEGRSCTALLGVLRRFLKKHSDEALRIQIARFFACAADDFATYEKENIQLASLTAYIKLLDLAMDFAQRHHPSAQIPMNRSAAKRITHNRRNLLKQRTELGENLYDIYRHPDANQPSVRKHLKRLIYKHFLNSNVAILHPNRTSRATEIADAGVTAAQRAMQQIESLEQEQGKPFKREMIVDYLFHSILDATLETFENQLSQPRAA